MASLILVVISIALLASVAAVSMNYIPADAYLRQMVQNDAELGLNQARDGVSRYLNANRNVEGNIIYPGDGVNMVPLFAPNYGFVPGDVRKEMTWEVTADHMSPEMPAVGICLRPVSLSSPIQRAAIQQLQGRLPVGSSFVSNQCNATSNEVGGTTLTFWVPLSHIN